MIDEDEIYNRCKEVTTIAIGQYLAQLPYEGVGTLPAIWTGKTPGPRGKHPFVIINIAYNQRNGSHTTDQYYRSDGTLIKKVYYDYYINFGVYGGPANQLKTELETSLVREDIKRIFSADSFSAIVDTYPAASQDFREANEVLQFASFILRLTVVDTVEETVDTMQTVEYTLNMDYRGS